MNFAQIQQFAPQITKIATKYGISKINVFGSVARRESTKQSDVDLLVEMEEGASLFSVAGFGYEVERLLGLSVDVVPISILPGVKDKKFAVNIQRDAIAL